MHTYTHLHKMTYGQSGMKRTSIRCMVAGVFLFFSFASISSSIYGSCSPLSVKANMPQLSSVIASAIEIAQFVYNTVAANPDEPRETTVRILITPKQTDATDTNTSNQVYVETECFFIAICLDVPFPLSLSSFRTTHQTPHIAKILIQPLDFENKEKI